MDVHTKSMNTIDEKTIIEAVRDGDHEQYRHIVERYNRGLIQHLTNMTHHQHMAEDIAQDAFIRAFEKIHSYNDSYAFSTWLYKIADNIAFRELKKVTFTTDIDDIQESLPSDRPSIVDQTNRVLESEKIRTAISTMHINYQRVITMYYWDNFSYDDIADIMDRPVGTVRTWLRRAKEELRKELYGQL
jgi:RNA polymerase sigma-70 factor (ECF subfamily)